jgi:spermidine/putrescine-binding protein
MRRFAGLAFALALAAHCGGGDGAQSQGASAGAASPEGRTLNVLVWTDYLVPELVEEFEKETGARVVESNFENNEELAAKLRAGRSGFDLVCPTDYAVASLVKDGLLAGIDPARVPNLVHLSPRFRDPPYDRGNRHSVPYQWGVTGIAWRKGAVDPAPTSWKDLFDEEKLARWKGRVSMLNDLRELTAAALLAAGHSPNTRDPAQIAEAGALLARQKPYLAKYDSNDFGTSLVAKETILAQGWNGQFANSQVEDGEILFVVPEEGALTYVDNWAIPKDAPDKDLAEQFIDFLLRPEVAAKAANERLYASVNESAKPMIDPAVLGGTAYDDGKGRKLFWVEDVGPAGDLYNRIWADLKAK